MEFAILDELWFGDISDQDAREVASRSLAARTARLHGLRPFPAAAQRLLQITAGDDYRVDQVTELIESDPTLATRLLRVVNSAASGLRKKCSSVHSAVTLLGQRNLRDIALATSIVMTFGSDEPEAVQIMEHSASVAALCRELARAAGLGPEEMYTCGLLHDIGKLMFLQAGDEDYPRMLAEHGADVHVKESERYGFDHAVLACQMLADWQIPAPVPMVVGWHHSLKRASERGDAAGRMVFLVHLCNRLAPAVHADQDDEFFEREAASHDAVGAGISAAMMQGLWKRLRDAARASVRSLSGLDGGETEAAEEPGAKATGEMACHICGEPSFGKSCPRCNGWLCTLHEPHASHLCARCEAEYRKAPPDRGGKWIAVSLIALALVCTVTFILLSGRGIVSHALLVATVLGIAAALGTVVWARGARRARFVRPTAR